MSADTSRNCDDGKSTPDDRPSAAIDQDTHEALRTLVRILAREAARELFMKSGVVVDPSAAEDEK